MTIKIKYSKNISNKNNKNIVLFSNDKFKIDGLKNIYLIQNFHIFVTY